MVDDRREVRPLFIGGDWPFPSSGETFESIDPATGEILARLSEAGELDVDHAVRAARAAFDEDDGWSLPSMRVAVLLRIADRITNTASELAELESLDTGKPLAQAVTDVTVAARYFRYYAGLADKLDGRVIPLGADFVDYTVREPYGVCGIITPWNYPLQIGARGVAPALAAGNAVVLKPSREASLTALKLAEIAHGEGLPKGRLNVLTGSGEVAGMSLVCHPQVDHISFTGSAVVGKKVAEAAARLVRPVGLELGGKSPNIIFADAELARAMPVVVRAILQNAGQTCSAGSRLLVHESVHDQVLTDLTNRMRTVRLGRGLDNPDLGPLISDRQREGVHKMVEQAQSAGARVATGGKTPKSPALARGYFYEPTVIHGVTPEMPIARDEVFGPVLAVSTFSSEEEAVELANGTPYGLVAAIWTRDLTRAHRVASLLKAGQIFVNTYGAGGGVELPFGGYKQSGYGRHKGIEGALEYTQIKNVCIAL